MSKRQFDLIVLGVGMAAVSAANKCAAAGWSVTVVDWRRTGKCTGYEVSENDLGFLPAGTAHDHEFPSARGQLVARATMRRQAQRQRQLAHPTAGPLTGLAQEHCLEGYRSWF